MKKLISFAGVAVLAGSAFAADYYYWNNKTGDSDLANKSNWTYKVGGAGTAVVPDTFPPALDTKTDGTTHPYIRFEVGGLLALSNKTELTLQDMVFPDTTPNTDWTIDLGSKTLKLFGNCDAAIWVGRDKPDGQRITLKSGTITTVQSAQRNSQIRLGGSATTNKRPAYFRLDGPNASVSDVTVAVNSPNCEFCVTNGAKAYVRKDSYALRMGDSSTVDVPGSRYVISGAGSLLQIPAGSSTGFFLGDNLSSPYTYGTGGGIVVTDGATVQGAPATIGNRKGNFYLFMDNATWNGTGIGLAGSSDGYATNNVMTVQNGSEVTLSGTLSVGQYGGYNRATLSGSSLTASGYIYVGQSGSGTLCPGYGHNALVVTNKSTVAAKFIRTGGATGPVSQYNTVFIDDSTVNLSEEFSIGYLDGGNTGVVQNTTLTAGSMLTLGVNGANGGGLGYNMLTLSNTTFTAGTTYVGGQGSHAANSCNNTLNVLDSEFTGANHDWHVGLNGGGTNHLLVAHSTGLPRTISVGRKGTGHNTVLVTNCTEFVPTTIEVGGNGGVGGSGSDGNVVRIVDSTFGSSGNKITQFQIGNSYKGNKISSNPDVYDVATSVPASSNVVEMVRSTWYNSVSYMGVGGWNGATRGCHGNAFVVDDHSLADCSTSSDGIRVGGSGFHNRLEVKNGSTLLTGGLALGTTTADHAYNGTNLVYVGTGSRLACNGYFQPCPGGNAVVVDDGRLEVRKTRFYYYWSDVQGKVIDSLSIAETEYGKPGKEIWGTRFVFKGANPVMRTPDAEWTSGAGAYSDLAFSRAHYLEFEFPAEPYEHGVLQSAQKVVIGDNTNYRFDCSKIAKSDAWKDYKLAEVDDGATLTVSNAEIARIQTALQAAAKAAGLKAKLALSSDGKKLLASFHKIKGLTVVIR